MNALSMEQIRRTAPSVFATDAYDNVSDRYRFIPTADVLDALTSEGWNVVGARQNMVRTEGAKEYAKHRLTLQHRDAKVSAVGDVVRRISLTNSHGAQKSPYVMDDALFRLACLNGLLVSSNSLDSVRVTHRGSDVIERVVQGTHDILARGEQVIDTVKRMTLTRLDARESFAFAESAALLRWEADEIPVKATRLLAPRRSADADNTLWATFNRVQENLVRGGLVGMAQTGRRTRTRAVTSINADTRLNKSLWQLAEKMLELKAA